MIHTNPRTGVRIATVPPKPRGQLAKQEAAAARKIAGTSYYVIDVARLASRIDPCLYGPYSTNELREAQAKLIRAEQSGSDALFWLDIDARGVPNIGTYSTGFCGPEDEAA